MKVRAIAAALAITFAGATVGTAAMALPTATNASAARPTAGPHANSLNSQIPCTIAGVASTCTLTVSSIQIVNGTLMAAGTVTGGGVTVPFSDVPLDPAGSCSILDLTLGPLNLDLLGLVVNLNTVHLNITAQQGPGNLLGNLLCSVAHLLDNSGAPNAVTQLLNQINTILAGL